MTNLSTSHCTRKLSEDEISQLRTSLLNELSVSPSSDPQQVKDEYENVSDLLDFVLAMIGNAKTAQYIVDELVIMEMEECDAEKAKNVGVIIAHFIETIEGGKTHNVEIALGKIKENEEKEANSSKMKSLLSSRSRNENALTKSGALGAATKKNALSRSGALGVSREGISADKQKNKSDNPEPKNSIHHQNHKNDNKSHRTPNTNQMKRKSQSSDRNGSERKGGGLGGRIGGKRSLASAAFGRLVKQNNMDQQRGGHVNRHQGNNGRNNSDGRGAHGRGPQMQRGGRGSGRGDFGPGRIINSNGQRARDQQTRNNNQGSGPRKHNNRNPELDFIPTSKDERNDGHNGRGRVDKKNIGRGRGEMMNDGRGRGQNRDCGRSGHARGNFNHTYRKGRGIDENQNAFSKRSYEGESHEGYNQNQGFGEGSNYDRSYQETDFKTARDGHHANKFFRGGRGDRGFTRGGRVPVGFNEGALTGRKRAEVVHPSPLVASSFTIASSFGGDTSLAPNPAEGETAFEFSGRGQVRGRGRAPIPGRGVVASMISAKTWVRPRTMNESLSTER